MFAAYEAKLVERLQARLSGVTIATTDDVARVPELRQKAPAVFVIYDGYSISEEVGRGRVTGIEQEFLVVCAAKSGTSRGNTTEAKVAASEISLSVLDALLGYDVGNGATLKLRDAPGPEYDGGFCYLPLLFSVRGTVKGSLDQ